MHMALHSVQNITTQAGQRDGTQWVTLYIDSADGRYEITLFPSDATDSGIATITNGLVPVARD